MKNIAIVGAGLAGLGAALDLRKRGYGVTLFDAEPEIGGRCRTFYWNGGWRIRGAYAFTVAETNLIDLARELGVYQPDNILDRSEMHVHRILRNGRTYDVKSMEMSHLMANPLLSIGEKLSLAKALPRLIGAGTNYLKLDDTTAYSHFRKASPAFVDYLLEPLMGLFCGYSEQDVSLGWLASTRSNPAVSNNSWWTFRKDGVGGLPRAFEAHFAKDPHVTTILEATVERVEDINGVAQVTYNHGGQRVQKQFDGAIIALQGPLAKQVFATPDTAQRDIMAASRYSHHDCGFFMIKSRAKIPIDRVILPAIEGYHCVANLEFERVDEDTVYIYGETKGDRGGLGKNITAADLLPRFMADVVKFHPPMAGAEVADSYIQINELGLPAFGPGYITALDAYNRSVTPKRIGLAGDWLVMTSVGSAHLSGMAAANNLHSFLSLSFGVRLMTKNDTPLVIKQNAEWDPLRTVVMAMATPFPTTFDSLLVDMDEASLHQFETNDYRPYDMDKVHVEQRAFIAAMEAEGVTVLLAEKKDDLVGQHYPRDIGFVIDDLFIWGRMRRAMRTEEQPMINHIVKRIPRVATLEAGSIEGGDVFVNGPNEVIVGYGEETSPEGVASLRKALAEHGIEREVLTLDLAERGAIHADTKFNIIGKELVMMNPKALAPHSMKEVEKRFQIIPATPEETRGLQINTLIFGDRKLAMSVGSERLAEEVAKHGITPVMLEYSEVNALPGSFRCTTLPLLRG